VGVGSVSLSQKKFLPIDLPAGVTPYIPDCSAFRPLTHPPIRIYTPEPEFSEEARRKRISGSVRLSLTVSPNGTVEDIEITKSLGHGLDEQALRAVQQWRFEPASKDGKPVSARIFVEVMFSLYNK
jgi:TonB family protein